MNALEYYKRWQNAALSDPELSRELAAIGRDPVEIEDRFSQDLSFGTGGMRGLMGAGNNRLNLYTVARATQAYARVLRRHFSAPRIAIAYDSRLLSRRFAETAAAVLAANGAAVSIFPNLMPTPALSFTVRHLGLSGGIVITASHNPAPYNGYKIYGPDGCQITPEAAREIGEEIARTDLFDGVRRGSFATGLRSGAISYLDDGVVGAYLDAVSAQSVAGGEPRDFPIVYTPLHGAGLHCVTRILARHGFSDVRVVPSQREPDGNFPTCRRPNPEEPEALSEGIRCAGEWGAQLVLATDPDCDRVGAAVRRGDGFVLLTGNQMGVLLLDFLCQSRRRSGTLPARPVAVKTIVTSEMVQHAALRHGVEMRNVLTGFKFIGEEIGRLEAAGEADRFVLGMEESYGYLAGTDIRDKDGVMASLLICEMAAYYRGRGMSLLDAFDQLSAKLGSFADIQRSVSFPGVRGGKEMAAVMERLRGHPPRQLLGRTLRQLTDYASGAAVGPDGKREDTGLPRSNVLRFAFGEDLTVTVRPSGTEPKLKLYVSARAENQRAADALAQKAAENGGLLS